MDKNPVEVINSFGNISLAIKHLFVSFAQELFALRIDYPWNSDHQTTKIIIADKFAVNLKVAEKKPAIFISREPYRWSELTIGQRSDPHPEGAFLPLLGVDRFQDLIVGRITFQVVAKSGIVAEDIANTLFLALTTFKVAFKNKGLHEINEIILGTEETVKSTSDIELTIVPLSIRYTANKDLALGVNWSSLTLFIEDDRQYQESDFYLLSGENNSHIRFFVPPMSGATITANYTNAVSLSQVTGEVVSGLVNGINQDFYTYYPVYSEYSIFSDTIISGVI